MFGLESIMYMSVASSLSVSYAPISSKLLFVVMAVARCPALVARLDTQST